MKTSFDTDAILFDLLRKSPLKNAISGGIYVGDTRPADSEDEDVVVNTITLTQDFLPQIATSNVNIYASDVNKTIKSKNQLQANRTRLKSLTDKAMTTLRGARITGLKLIPTSQVVLAEPSVKQHFVNIRIEWNIQTD